MEIYIFFREIHVMWVAMGEYADLSVYDVVDEVGARRAGGGGWLCVRLSCMMSWVGGLGLGPCWGGQEGWG